MEQAACKGLETELWFPEPLESASYARAVCSGCTVRRRCLLYSLDNGITFGIWGGVGERERRSHRRMRRMTQEVA
jgi:WhiB family redox-sensing transcriptional regulator